MMVRIWGACLACFLSATLAGADEGGITFGEGPILSCLEDTSVTPVACVGLGAADCMTREDGGAATDTITLCHAREAEFWEARLEAAQAALGKKSADWDADLGDQSMDAAGALDAMVDAWHPYATARCDFVSALWGPGSGAGPALAECQMRALADQALFLEYIIQTY